MTTAAALAGSPAPAAARAVQALKDKETAKRMEGHGADVATSTPAELGALVTSELAKWKQVVQRAKLTAD